MKALNISSNTACTSTFGFNAIEYVYKFVLICFGHIGDFLTNSRNIQSELRYNFTL